MQSDQILTHHVMKADRPRLVVESQEERQIMEPAAELARRGGPQPPQALHHCEGDVDVDAPAFGRQGLAVTSSDEQRGGAAESLDVGGLPDVVDNDQDAPSVEELGEVRSGGLERAEDRSLF